MSELRTTETTATTPVMSLPSILAFAASNLPIAGISTALAIFLQPYFATHLGLPLMVIAGAWFTVRMLDFGIDVALGLIMDRFSSPWGRYRLWFAAGVPILMLAVYKLYMAKPGIDGTYLITWLFVFYLGQSIVLLSHLAWRATLVTDYHGRSRVYGLMAPVSILGSLVVLMIPAIAEKMGHTAMAVPWIGWFGIVTLPLAAAIVLIFTREPIAPEVKRDRTVPWADYWDLVRNPSFLRLLIGEAFLILGPGWMTALYVFFFTHSRGFTVGQGSILLGAYVLAGLIGAPAASQLAMRFGKHRTLFVTAVAYALGLTTIMLVPKGSLLGALPTMIWCGAMAAGFGIMTSAMTADFGDEIRLEQGKERITLIYAFTSLMGKLANASAGFLTYSVLAAVGFNPAEGAVNSASAIRGLELAYTIGPVICVVIGGACFLGWRLDADTHADIRTKLDARDAEAAGSL